MEIVRDEFVCQSCKRQTLSALCGCADPRPVKFTDVHVLVPFTKIGLEREGWDIPPDAA